MSERFEESAVRSKDVARRRLKNVLVSDRNGLSRADIEQLRCDIEAVVSSALDIKTTRIDMNPLNRTLVFTAEIGSAKRVGVRASKE